MKKKYTAERRNEIAKMLEVDGVIHTTVLAERYGVSTETIRKDILALEQNGLAMKTYGGAISTKAQSEDPISVKASENKDLKERIAAAAEKLIPENGTILLDGGSTTYTLAEKIAGRNDLTVVTNSVNIMHLLGDSGNKVLALGGIMRPSSRSTVGEWAVRALSSLNIPLAFIGTDGFGGCDGPSSSAYEEAELKRIALRRSQRLIVLADHTKFVKTHLFQVCSWDEVFGIVTDRWDDPDILVKVRDLESRIKVYYG